jgi:hypothetical protein
MKKVVTKKPVVKKTTTPKVKEVKKVQEVQEIKEVQEVQEVNAVNIVVSELQENHLKSLGFNFIWLHELADKYEFDRFDYIEKFCAFRCIKNDFHIEWIDVNSLALLNGKQMLCKILNKHQPLGKSRKIIQLPWETL